MQITIERTWTRGDKSTTSAVKIYNERNKVVSSSAKDAAAIIAHFAIDAANPLNIITQDMARQFLAAGKDDARKKYAMFMEGTMLQEIDVSSLPGACVSGSNDVYTISSACACSLYCC